MDFLVGEQINIFLWAIVCGVITGIINEPFRFMRYVGFSSKTEIFIQDIIFMSICGAITFFFSLCYNNGNVRVFIIFGELVGFLLFRYSVGLLSGKIFGVLFWLIKTVISWIKKILNAIFIKITNIISYLIAKIPLFHKKSKIACNRGKFYCIITKSINVFKR